MGLLDSNADANGWLAVLAASCILAAAYMAVGIHRDLRERQISCIESIRQNSHRILIGASIILICHALRLVTFLPVWVYRYAGARDHELGFTAGANLISNVLAIITLIGLCVMMEPVFRHQFGKSIWWIVGGSAIAVYLVGAFGTIYFAQFL